MQNMQKCVGVYLCQLASGTQYIHLYFTVYKNMLEQSQQLGTQTNSTREGRGSSNNSTHHACADWQLKLCAETKSKKSVRIRSPDRLGPLGIRGAGNSE